MADAEAPKVRYRLELVQGHSVLLTVDEHFLHEFLTESKWFGVGPTWINGAHVVTATRLDDESERARLERAVSAVSLMLRDDPLRRGTGLTDVQLALDSDILAVQLVGKVRKALDG